MKPTELLTKHCVFKTEYDCYVLLAVSRKKDTPEITNSQEIVFREVIKNEKDIVRKYNKIKAQVTSYKDEEGKSYPFYIYVSLNRRDALKATFLLTGKIDGWVQEELGGTSRSKMFKKLYGHFYSCLMMEKARSTGQKHFMIDFDTKDEKDKSDFDSLLRDLNVEVVFTQETRNGHHYKVKPFNRELLQKTDIYETKTDANFFVEYVENKQNA